MMTNLAWSSEILISSNRSLSEAASSICRTDKEKKDKNNQQTINHDRQAKLFSGDKQRKKKVVIQKTQDFSLDLIR